MEATQVEKTTSATCIESVEKTYTVGDEKRVLRKIDRTILPWIMLMYFLSYMDRYAHLQIFV